jgi:tripartite-type tricarboxylate transporter receptor subunit TctC
MSEALRADLGQPIVVDNRGGAAGVIGAQAVANAAPDGYTLLFTSSALNMVAAMGTRTGYDVRTSFVPIANVAWTPSLLVAHPSLGLKTPQDLVALAKAKPGQLFYATAGHGAPSHFVTEMFRARTGIDAVAIPFRGSPEAMIDQIAGRVQFSVANSSTALPPQVAERIALAVNNALARADVLERLAPTGNEVDGKSTPESFARLIRDDMDIWAEVARTANIKAQ